MGVVDVAGAVVERVGVDGVDHTKVGGFPGLDTPGVLVYFLDNAFVVVCESGVEGADGAEGAGGVEDDVAAGAPGGEDELEGGGFDVVDFDGDFDGLGLGIFEVDGVVNGWLGVG